MGAQGWYKVTVYATMINPRTDGKITPLFFWKILGIIGLGFSELALISNLAGIANITMMGLVEDRHTWDVLASDSIPLYGLILIVVCGSAFILIARRAITHTVMGYFQIVIIMAAVSIPTLLDYLTDYKF